MSCTVTPKNIIYLTSKDNILTFKDFSKIFLFLFYFYYCTLHLDNRQTPHSQVAINLPKYSPDIGLSEQNYLENSLWGERVSGS